MEYVGLNFRKYKSFFKYSIEAYMGGSMNYLYKLMGAAIVFLVMITIGLPVLYFGTYDLINHVDTTIYARYATNGKYDENIYFNESIEKETGFFSEIRNSIEGASEINRIQEFGQIVNSHSKEIETLINHNDKYKNYLTEQGSSAEELILWSQKIAALDDNIGVMCIYLICVVFAFITVGGFKLRKTFYLFAGTVYMITMTSVFSDGLSDYLVMNFMNFISKFSARVFTYQEMNDLKIFFVQAFKESMLTFIIFDTIIQILQGNKDKRREEEIRKCVYSLDYVINFLKEYENRDEKYISGFRIPCKEVLRKCKKNKKKKCYQELEHELLYGDFWRDIHNNKEYIDKLEKIRMHIYLCNLV